MTKAPDTRYAQSGEVSIAYQVVGDGPIDLVIAPGFVSHLEIFWEQPLYARYVRRLASFARVILFDKRGTGLSDRAAGMATLEERMDDIRAVMDAAGSRQAAIMGVSEGGPMSLLFAATYPERTRSLILYGTYARQSWAPDHPWGLAAEKSAANDEMVRSTWGTPQSCRSAVEGWLAPSMAHDPAFVEWFTKLSRSGMSPGAVVALRKMNRCLDARNLLSTIHVPTLVLHRADDRGISAASGQYLADRIPSARLVILPGKDHMTFVGDSDALADEIELFLTGERSTREADRVLATVLFTDIVESTRCAAELGDRRWKDLLADHDALSREEVERFRGRAIKSTGDGLLATFDGPIRGIRCASAIRDRVRILGIDVRAGLHTGEIELLGDDISGIAVNIAARVMGEAPGGEVWVSRTVHDLVAGSDLAFEERGAYGMKGVPGEWQLYSIQ